MVHLVVDAVPCARFTAGTRLSPPGRAEWGDGDWDIVGSCNVKMLSGSSMLENRLNDWSRRRL